MNHLPALLLLATCVSCVGTEVEKPSKDLFHRLTDESKPWERSAAMRDLKALAEADQQALVQQLIAALSADGIYTRQNAIEALGDLEAAAAVPQLRRAQTDSEAAVRRRATVALARMGEDTPGLLDLLLTDLRSAEMLTRFTAANDLTFIAMGRAHVEITGAVPALIEVVEKDASQPVRVHAIDALGFMKAGAVSAVPVLTKACEDQNRNVASTAAWALKQIRGGSE